MTGLLSGDAFWVTAFITLAIIAAMVFVRFATGDDGWFRWPGLFQATLAALDAAGRLLHIRWPCWLIEWAWNRQATPGPDELLRKGRHRARHDGRPRP